LVKEGDIMTRKRYAKTLQTIADEGASVFYKGSMAKSMVETARRSNGTITLDDFEHYRAVSRPALNITYRGLTVFGAGSPAGGAVCLNILRTMERYSPGAWIRDGRLTIHRLAEAMRFAYGARADLGDPAFVEDVNAHEDRMLSLATAKDTASRISDNHTLPVEQYLSKHRYAADSHGTSHVVTADESGMAASLTTTINLLFGAQIMDPKTGIILNNEMNDFSIPNVRNEFGFEPTEANFIRPFKRPLSSITPLIAANPDGSLAAVIGAAGGSRIISSTAQTFWHSVEHGLSLAEALREPRMHDQLMPNHVMVEYAFDNSTVDSLRERGHNVTWVAEGLSAVQAIKRHENGTFEAASEPRQKNSGAMAV
jgi:gamma-glutamyltranspeptidase/glutathione hydrolase